MLCLLSIIYLALFPQDLIPLGWYEEDEEDQVRPAHATYRVTGSLR